ncbi:unnamed protein product [Rotaria socialis]|uniref:Uncharacterized protein n=1 Tax=Rotaria socialis TaxID=392032 RepID=A0A819W9H3_9BILA|nr:unnamed protein product [Rotaria socialis]CAF3434569.1 unnamed protein product [Rotaria socialis]CAF3439961.1 unnamed protein product [Rotaria socialis]CAF3502707.1 unnamed protein product [Rotaria socialis]CAF3638420.1 unnamed protein product [Rotaria socialis]
MSSMTSNLSDNTIKLNYLNSPISHSMRPYHTNTLSDIDTKSVGSKSTSSRTSKLTYSEYPQVRPTNPLYSSTFSIRTHSSAISNMSKTSTVVERRKKFDPHTPKHPDDWRWFAVLCIFLCPLIGPIAYGLAFKAQVKFRDGFTDESRKLNSRALILCIISVILGVGILLGLLFAFDSWPRSNG